MNTEIEHRRAEDGNYILSCCQVVPVPRSEAFRFFSEAANLGRLTPRSLNFRILTKQPIAMKPGCIIEYRLSLHGFPMFWRTRIDRYEPEECFTDLQLRGPYALWHHLHEFVEVPGGTEIRDTVTYRLPFGWFGRIGISLVRRSLNQIFSYRQQVISEVFGEK